MEAFALYLLKSSVWLTGFAAVYFLFLRNERFFVLNRIFLIAGILASIGFPFFTWRYTVVFPVMPMATVENPQVQAIGVISKSAFQAKDLLLDIYLIGALYLIYRLVKQTTSVWQLIRKSETLHFNSVKLIRSDRYPASFSFFSFVFVNPSTHEHEIKEIVNHEQEHIRQRHWIDLLMFEILCTIQWFNPIVWIYGRFIRQNHEFLADEYALRRSPNPAIYRAALLNQMFGGPVISLANSFNYSINKKRFNMMKQITYSPFRKLKLLLVLPLIAGVFYAFATPEYKFVQGEGNIEVSNVQQSLKTVKGRVVKEDGTPLRGTSIVVKNGTNGTLSGENGVFELKVENDMPLVFSFVGFESQEVKPHFSKEMEVTMKRVVISIDAMGNNPSDNKKKKANQEVTTSTSAPLIVKDGVVSPELKMNDINPYTIESINVLKDEMAITKYGVKGQHGVVEVTTKEEFSATKSKPLIVIDKVIATNQNMDNIDPESIESITVLKDQSATILYGEKGKNGVVLITLKKDVQNKNSEIEVVGYAKDQKQPLIVIDGVVSDKKMDDIKPETIESINVLKGDLATKKYGSAGKDGVLEITLKKPKEVFVVVEELPKYPGGVLALKEFVSSTLKYPTIALENKIVGQVTVGFTVAEDGSVTDAKVTSGVDPSLDQEALRIVNSMPKWTPGKQRGMAVKVAYQLPINFTYPTDYHPKNQEKLKEMKTK